MLGSYTGYKREVQLTRVSKRSTGHSINPSYNICITEKVAVVSREPQTDLLWSFILTGRSASQSEQCNRNWHLEEQSHRNNVTALGHQRTMVCFSEVMMRPGEQTQPVNMPNMQRSNKTSDKSLSQQNQKKAWMKDHNNGEKANGTMKSHSPLLCSLTNVKDRTHGLKVWVGSLEPQQGP